MREMIPKRIGKIDFALMGPKEFRKLSATKVITADTYDDDGFPIPMGLMDLHMGVIEPGLRCKTSGRKMDEDPGHFGHIELAKPMYHLSWFNNILKTLRCVCTSCSVILGDEPIDEQKGPDQVQRKLIAAFKKKNPAHRLRSIMEVAG